MNELTLLYGSVFTGHSFMCQTPPQSFGGSVCFPEWKNEDKVSKLENFQHCRTCKLLTWRTWLEEMDPGNFQDFWTGNVSRFISSFLNYQTFFQTAEIFSQRPPKITVNDETVGGGSAGRRSDWRLERSWCESIRADQSQSNNPSAGARARQKVKTSAGIRREIRLYGGDDSGGLCWQSGILHETVRV